PVAREEPVAPQRVVLPEMPALGATHLFGEVGMADEADAARPEPEAHHIAVLAGAAGVELDDALAELGQVTEQPVPRRTGGQGFGGHAEPRKFVARPSAPLPFFRHTRERGFGLHSLILP